MVIEKRDLMETVKKYIDSTKITDVHTHLFPPQFGNLALWGPDELITYHYLIPETLRCSDISYKDFWSMKKSEQADYIFKTLFINNSPISEACRGVLTSFKQIGIDVSKRNLDEFRKYYNNFNIDQYVDKVFELANIKKVFMTNDPFDEKERSYWNNGVQPDNRFIASLRLDTLLNNYQAARYTLISMGYDVGRSLTGIAKKEIKRFLKDWIKKTDAAYMAVSLPPDFSMPQNSVRDMLIEDCVLPVAYELNIPLALMIGVKRHINPDLYIAGDSVGKSSIEAIEYLCSKFYKNKFMITMLARENQHELCVTARKFRNLYLFGCWWFLNIPVLIEEITRIRLELLGTSFLAQHSDARVLDQLIYKWSHSKKILIKVLCDKYIDLYDTGWPIEEKDIKRDVEKLLGESFNDFIDLVL